MLRRLITGSREWPADRYQDIWNDCHEADHLILGDCETGADLWGRRFAEFYQRSHVVHVANWLKHGPGAGPRRNSMMVADEPTDACAYLVSWRDNRGTKDCGRKLRHAGVLIHVRRA